MTSIKNSKIGIIIFSRFSSERLRGKAMINIKKRPLLGHIIDRVKKVGESYPIIVATSSHKSDDIIENFSKSEGLEVFRGNLTDVMNRALLCCQKFKFDSFVRICGDRIFLSPKLINKMIKVHLSKKVDLTTNNLKKTYPFGLTTEIISVRSLEKVFQKTKDPFDREHITNFYYKNSNEFSIENIESKNKMNPNLNLSVDTKDDLSKVRWILTGLPKPYADLDIEKIIKRLENYNIRVKKCAV
ncbi:MAG: hypothetical protein CL572_04540 [Alphaproteobacteria bacterium]|nr:hypothetical protein [Alphaproteobacteria bacterium]